jgi:hypothetical protein
VLLEGRTRWIPTLAVLLTGEQCACSIFYLRVSFVLFFCSFLVGSDDARINPLGTLMLIEFIKGKPLFFVCWINLMYIPSVLRPFLVLAPTAS